MHPLLAERITRIAERSASFRDAWDMIQASGVPVTIGTDEQLHEQLPRWFRHHPSRWVGVTVSSSGLKGGLDRAVVAVRIRALESTANGRSSYSHAHFLAEVDRILIHEIYGHLTPVVAARDPGQECPDHLRRGEVKPCVNLREEAIVNELADYQQAARANRPAR
jgi:hypothetical protein